MTLGVGEEPNQRVNEGFLHALDLCDAATEVGRAHVYPAGLTAAEQVHDVRQQRGVVQQLRQATLFILDEHVAA